ncbi:hypothetical protein EYF80_032025 [Liparis tanakae]|uniref:Uncharacterized protein n=1 Tax=Liparis tanakae TaxID=230148 RepID=A0A4Z2GVS7_9TELE|nr:hypothetical protein EYF80_032025 [Liparis tanakae]
MRDFAHPHPTSTQRGLHAHGSRHNGRPCVKATRNNAETHTLPSPQPSETECEKDGVSASGRGSEESAHERAEKQEAQDEEMRVEVVVVVVVVGEGEGEGGIETLRLYPDVSEGGASADGDGEKGSELNARVDSLMGTKAVADGDAVDPRMRKVIYQGAGEKKSARRDGACWYTGSVDGSSAGCHGERGGGGADCSSVERGERDRIAPIR